MKLTTYGTGYAVLDDGRIVDANGKPFTGHVCPLHQAMANEIILKMHAHAGPMNPHEQTMWNQDAYAADILASTRPRNHKTTT